MMCTDTENEITSALSGRVIIHPALVEAAEQVWRSISLTAMTRSPCSPMITGRSGVGKSLLCEYLRTQLGKPGIQETSQEIVLVEPCIVVEVPAQPTILTLSREIALKLGVNLKSYESSQAVLKEIVITRLKTMRVKLLILDEFHRLIDRGGRKSYTAICRYITDILNNSCTPILLVGTPVVWQLVDQVEELSERYPFRAKLQDFDFPTEENGYVFTQVLLSYQEILAKELGVTGINFSDPKILRAIYVSTQGNFRRVRNLLCIAVQQTYERGSKILTIEDFSFATRTLYPTKYLQTSPFELDEKNLNRLILRSQNAPRPAN